jgi:hypothetical protein
MRVPRSAIPLLIVVAGLAAACDSEPPSPERAATASPAPVASDTTLLDCPEQNAVVDGPPRGSLTGDVTGDGEEEVVSLYLDDDGAPGCEAFLELGDGGPVVPVTQEGMSSGPGFPNLVGLAQIDGRPGLDVIVRLLAGASTEFVGVFSAAPGHLERLTVEDSSGLGDLFPYGGGVTHLDGIDCDDDGRVVISSAVSEDAETYTYTRTVYELEGSALVPVETDGSQVTVAELQDIPEFARSPFGSCPS